MITTGELKIEDKDFKKRSASATKDATPEEVRDWILKMCDHSFGTFYIFPEDYEIPKFGYLERGCTILDMSLARRCRKINNYILAIDDFDIEINFNSGKFRVYDPKTAADCILSILRK